MKRTLGFALAFLGVVPLAAQTDIGAQLAGRVPATVIQATQSLAESAAVTGVPVAPLVQKALEGAAKNVPADRVVVALQALFTREVTALGALQQGGIAAPDPMAVDGATFALSAGLSSGDVSAIARAGGTTYAPSITMRVAGTLAALGVPAAGTVRLVSVALASGVSPGDLGSFPGSVESALARGMTPAQAAAGLARATEARGGVPPSQGRPAGRPHAP
ncbi:MAG TPA: hypothetical protein VH163_11145 [Gemmatimonadales bacterium]|nr:hypothetical protein [Gemmatimonadales bacterium]